MYLNNSDHPIDEWVQEKRSRYVQEASRSNKTNVPSRHWSTDQSIEEGLGSITIDSSEMKKSVDLSKAV